MRRPRFRPGWVFRGLREDRFVRQLATYREHCQREGFVFRLYHFRADIRRLIHQGCGHHLFSILDSGQLFEAQVAIWLLGRMRWRRARDNLVWCASENYWEIRKESIRALQRLNAWAQLDRIAAREADEQLRRLARARPPGEFLDRLDEYLESRLPDEFPPLVRRPLQVHSQLPGEPRSPKPLALIRQILQRISQLVRKSREAA